MGKRRALGKREKEDHLFKALNKAAGSTRRTSRLQRGVCIEEALRSMRSWPGHEGARGGCGVRPDSGGGAPVRESVSCGRSGTGRRASWAGPRPGLGAGPAQFGGGFFL